MLLQYFLLKVSFRATELKRGKLKNIYIYLNYYLGGVKA